MRKRIPLIVLLVVLVSLPLIAADVDVFFSLDDDPEAVIINAISQAKESIDIAMYYFTDREIAQAVLAAHKRGVKIRIYLDKSQVKGKYSKSRYLLKKGIKDIRISSNNYIMHNKFAIIDDKIVITGSYNWTASASERNDENLLIIHDEDIAKIYTDKFEDYWNNQVSQKRTQELIALAK